MKRSSSMRTAASRSVLPWPQKSRVPRSALINTAATAAAQSRFSQRARTGGE